MQVQSCDKESCQGKLTAKLRTKAPGGGTQVLVVKKSKFYLTDGKPSIGVTQGYDEQSVINFGDFNFDGLEDVALQYASDAGYMGMGYNVYLNKDGKLVKNAAFSELVDSGSLGFFEVIAKRKRLSTSFKDGCCFHETREYEVIADALVLVRTISETEERVTEKVLRNGRWEERSTGPEGFEEDGSSGPAPGAGASNVQIPADIAAALALWTRTQNEGNFSAYSALYAPNFAGVRRSGSRVRQLDLQQWLEDRERMFRKPMKVAFEPLEWKAGKGRMEILGVQRFSLGKYSDQGKKRLLFVRDKGTWKIAEEELLNSEIIK